MKKLLLTVLVAALLVMGVLPAAATPVDQLSALAHFYPDNTPYFIANRIDAAYIDTLDALLADINAKVGFMPPGESLRGQLDSAAAQITPGGTFESVFGPWLGDTIAVGITDIQATMDENWDADVPTVIAVAIRDTRAVEIFIDNLLASWNLVKEQTNEGILYRPQQPSAYGGVLYLTSGVLLYRTSALDAMSIIPNFDTSLADNPAFNEALGRLPQSDYDTLAYFDFAGLDYAAQQFQSELKQDDFPLAIDLPAVMEAMGGQAAGITIRGQSLVLDIAVHIADLPAFEAATGSRLRSYDPINLDFTNRLPASTAMFIQATNYGPNTLETLQDIYELGERFEDQMGQGQLSSDDEGLAALDESVTFMRQSFKGLSGQTMDEAFGWMTGNSIFYLNIVAFNGRNAAEVPAVPDLGMMVEATDSAAATALVEAMRTLLYELGLDTVDEDGTLVLPLFGNMFGDDSLDMLLAHRNGLLISGTRPGVQATFNGGGLVATPAFQNARTHFLPDAQSLMFMNVPAVSDMLNRLVVVTNDPDLQELARVLLALESVSMTATASEQGSGVARLVVTLAGQ